MYIFLPLWRYFCTIDEGYILFYNVDKCRREELAVKNKIALLGLLLLMAAAFFLGFGLTRCSSNLPVNLPSQPDTPTGPIQTVAPTSEVTAPVTAPPETTVPETEPLQTAPPVTRPPQTPPPQTQPPETTSSAPTDPPVTEPDFPATEPDPYSLEAYEISDFALEIMEQINRVRAENSLPSLIVDQQLCAIASIRAYELNHLHAEQRPDGRDSQSLLADYGYACVEAGICLAYVSEDIPPDLLVTSWLGQHEDLILSKSYTHFGVEIYRSGGEINIALYLTVPAQVPS